MRNEDTIPDMQVLKVLRAVMVSSLLLCSAAACTSTGSSADDSATAALEDREFVLQFADGYTPVPGTVIRLSFVESSLSLHAQCNTVSSSYRISGSKLSVSDVTQTAMGCDEALMKQDDWLVEFLESVPTVTLKHDTLTLQSEDVVLVFVDREVADPNRPLVGPIWTIDTLITADTASTIPASKLPPTVVFKDDGSFAVSTACDSGTGTYDSTAIALALSDVTFTESTCTDEASSTLSRHLSAVFADGPAVYSIESARLTIEREDIGIGASANE
jgi:heat shock protein HslJ